MTVFLFFFYCLNYSYYMYISGPWTQVGKYQADLLGPEEMDQPRKLSPLFFQHFTIIIVKSASLPLSCALVIV